MISTRVDRRSSTVHAAFVVYELFFAGRIEFDLIYGFSLHVKSALTARVPFTLTRGHTEDFLSLRPPTHPPAVLCLLFECAQLFSFWDASYPFFLFFSSSTRF